jgi:sugar/nucleoside kinase (ribokinase family)
LFLGLTFYVNYGNLLYSFLTIKNETISIYREGQAMTQEICKDGLITSTRGVGNCLAAVGPSVNEEISFVADLPRPDADGFDYRPGRKNVVRSIERSFSREDDETYEITSEGGCKIVITAKTGTSRRFPAGSSINVAFALNFLGISDTGVVAPVGTGKTGKFLERAMLERKLKLLLFERQGTALSLSIRDPSTGKSTVFCEKPPFTVGEEVLAHLRAFTPRVVFATSVKPMDLSIVSAMFEGIEIRIFNPNPDLIRSEAHRRDLESLMARSNIVQMNDDEAGALLGGEFNVNNAHERIKEFESFGQKIIIVTLGEYGAVMLEKGGTPVLRPVFTIEAKDQTGAGDIHLAAFVYYYCLRGKKPPIDVCLQMAGWIAACKVATVGPWSGMPSQEERKKKLLEYWPDYPK